MKKIFDKYFWLLVVLIFIANIGWRFWYLGSPNWPIFDEVYYPKYALNFLHDESYFDVHPPLGKIFIAASIYLFGDSPFAWRFSEALFGLGVLIIIFFFVLSLFKSRLIALVSLILASFSMMLFVESRLGLINIFLVFFIILGLYLFWLFYIKKNFFYFIGSLASLSLATSVKWIGFLPFIAIIIFLILIYFYHRENFPLNRKNYWLVLLTVLISVAIYLGGFYLTNKSDFGLVEWHKQALGFHLNLTEHHPYQSPWWSWPLGIRPIWLEFKDIGQGKYVAIIEMINIPLIWLGVLAFFYSLWEMRYKNNEQLVFLILTILVLFLPWALVKRITFLYLFLPVVPLLIILEANFLGKLLKNKSIVLKIIACILIFLIAGFFLYFYPLLTGKEIDFSTYQKHMWLKSWY